MTYKEFSQYVDSIIKIFYDNYWFLQKEIISEYNKNTGSLKNYIFDIDKSIMAHTISVLLAIIFSNSDTNFKDSYILKSIVVLTFLYISLQIIRYVIDKIGYRKQIDYINALNVERLKYLQDIHQEYHATIPKLDIDFTAQEIDNNKINKLKDLNNKYIPDLYSFKQSCELETKSFSISLVGKVSKIIEGATYIILSVDVLFILLHIF